MSVITQPPVAAWDFDEGSGNAVDSVGGLVLTNNNTATYSAGKINNAVNLVAASSQSMSLADEATMSFTSDCSFSFYLKLTSNPGSGLEYNLITKFNPTGNQRSYQLLYSENTGNFDFNWNINTNGGAGGTNVTWASVNLSTGVWHHVVITYAAAAHTSELFINNVSQGTRDSVRTSIFNSTAAFVIGSTNAGGSYLNGSVDALYPFNRTLVAADVAELYANGGGRQYPFAQNGFFKS